MTGTLHVLGLDRVTLWGALGFPPEKIPLRGDTFCLGPGEKLSPVVYRETTPWVLWLKSLG